MAGLRPPELAEDVLKAGGPLGCGLWLEGLSQEVHLHLRGLGLEALAVSVDA